MLKLEEWYSKQVPYPLQPEHKNTRKNDDVTNVYVFASEESLLCKIGITTNIRNRLKQVQSASGQPICLLLSITLAYYDEDCKVIESALHQYFKQKRRYGEWFSLSVKDLIEIRRLFWSHIEGEHIEDNISDLLNNLKLKKAHP
jgi:predicted GIY-YIG superfamily endonuclease